MAKKSSIERNKKRERLSRRFAVKRGALKAQMRDKELSPEDRFQAMMKLANLPRNSAPSRIRLRCLLSGRPRGNYRKFKLSRIALRDMGSNGQIPGMIKSSW
jgi:small subunit ribosomal protein S14